MTTTRKLNYFIFFILLLITCNHSFSNNQVSLINDQFLSKEDLILVYSKGDFIGTIKQGEKTLLNQNIAKEERVEILKVISSAYENLELYENVIITEKKIAELISTPDNVVIPSVWSLYLKLGLFQESLDNFRLMKSKKETPISHFNLASLHNNEGVIFMKWGKIDSAIIQYNIALKEIEHVLKTKQYFPSHESYSIIFRNLILGNIGQCLLLMENYEAAIPFLESDNITSKLREDTKYNLIINYNLLALCYLELLKPEMARTYLDSSGYLLEERQEIESKIQYYSLLSRYFKTIKQFDSSIIYLEKHIQLKDSIYHQRINSKTLNSIISYDLRSHKDALDSNKNKLSISEYARQKELKLRYILLLGILLLVLFSIIYMVYSKKLKENQIKLELQNKEINKQKRLLESSLKEKEILLKEVHHRVKNNLQVISGLFELQKEFFDDPSILKILEDSQRRVTSISIVHQKLYEYEDYSNIYFKDYVNTITNSVIVSQSKPKQKITYHLGIDDFKINFDTAVPIGLILNELVTNSIKHSLYNEKSGIIYINTIRNDEQVELRLKDSNKNTIKVDMENSSGLGFKLIKGLTWQLGGNIKFDENNQEFVMNFLLKQ